MNPIIGILLAGLVTFLIGGIFELTLLRPMHLGKVERPGEYAILLTFGLAFFLEYTVLATLGANPRKLDPFFDIGSTVNIGIISLPSSRVIAAGLGLLILAILLWFLNYTWMGKALRAVSQDKQAAAVVGINPLTMNTLAFGLGAMLAGLSGAALVQVLAWVPNIAPLASARSFVVIVLGGMGSLPGAMVGGLIIGVVESLGVGCFPDVSRALAYQQVFGMIIFAIVLLLKPTGLFGREL
jgi:branched-chain amino acid transport system permease protein